MQGDVVCEGGVITQLGSVVTPPEGAREVCARNMYVMPGGVDPHTHLAMPFMGTVAIDDYYHGQRTIEPLSPRESFEPILNS